VIWNVNNLYDSEPHGIYKVFSTPNILPILVVILLSMSLISIIRDIYVELFVYFKFSISVVISLLLFSQYLGSDMFDAFNKPLLHYGFGLLIVLGMFVSLVLESKLNRTSIKLTTPVILIRGAILIAFPIFTIWFSVYIYNTYLVGWLFEWRIKILVYI